jgi:hypothetical protein
MNMADEKTNAYSALNRTEATWVADWLKEVKGKTVKGGWMGVFQMNAAEVAKKFHVSTDEVLSAARGEQRR